MIDTARPVRAARSAGLRHQRGDRSSRSHRRVGGGAAGRDGTGPAGAATSCRMRVV